MNADLAQRVLDELSRVGVSELVVCPAGRNAPWVELLTSCEYRFKVTWHFEERSAAFFALGRVRATGQPVAVCTTSGTAVGELLPAAMEAYYSGLPLVLLTADRPVRFRGSGAPQAAHQPEIFGIFTAADFDLEGAELLDLGDGRFPGPIHINVCFEDPNGHTGEVVALPEQAIGDAAEFLDAYRQPLVVVGGLHPTERREVEQFLLSLGAPTYFEAPSGLRENPRLEHIRMTQGDNLFSRATSSGYAFDCLIRLGSVPTHRLWRDLEDKFAALPVLSLSRLPFTGLGRPSALVSGELPTRAGPCKGDGIAALLRADRDAKSRLETVLSAEPSAEQALFEALSRRIEPGAQVFLGNSMPVREWDLAATWEDRHLEVVATRGLNGIDGQISTFLGMCRPDRPNWAILGDLTTLYDLAGPWVSDQLAPGISATIVIVNNSGGRIFERMFAPPEFQNEHSLTFGDWAAQWRIPYQRVTSVEAISSAASGMRIVELVPDHEATNRAWQQISEALK